MRARIAEIFPTTAPNHMVNIAVKMARTPKMIKRIPMLLPSFSLLTGSHVIQKPASKEAIPFVRAIDPIQIKNTPIINPIPVSIPNFVLVSCYANFVDNNGYFQFIKSRLFIF